MDNYHVQSTRKKGRARKEAAWRLGAALRAASTKSVYPWNSICTISGSVDHGTLTCPWALCGAGQTAKQLVASSSTACLLDRAELYFLTGGVSNPRRTPRYLLSAIESLVVHRQQRRQQQQQQQRQQLCPTPSPPWAPYEIHSSQSCAFPSPSLSLCLDVFRFSGTWALRHFLCFVSLTRPEA